MFKDKHFLACIALLAIFTAVSWNAVSRKGPAYDEPYHAISAWVQLHFHDYRIDNEDPPLWQYWASLPNGIHGIEADTTGPIWQSMTHSVVRQWYWGVQTLYRTPGNDAVEFLNRARAMMLCWGVVLGALICFWSWKIAGPVAAVFSTWLFCFDPNFLSHSALMKNDVVFALSMFALVYALWKAGQNLTAAALARLLVFTIITLSVKFSGFVAVLTLPTLLFVRAIFPTDWPVLGRIMSSTFSRACTAAMVMLLAALTSYFGIWAVYGFRYSPTPQADVSLNIDELSEQTRINDFLRMYRGDPPPGASPNQPMRPVVHAALFANQNHLLPQAFIAGFLFTYANALVRQAYALGHLSAVGWWWYFPFAILVKTPVITLLVLMLTAFASIRSIVKRGLNSHSRRWTALCLLIPPILFLTWAMASNLNIGVRHVLVIYPFAFVAAGWSIRNLWNTGLKKIQITIVLGGVLLAAESAWQFPGYLAFFNVASTTFVGNKIGLLGDSNLDWGQDLPLLRDWQQKHPREKLYLAYFGYADPAYYGIKYIPLPGGYHYDPPPHFPDMFEPCVVAVSASNLQGFALHPELRRYYAQWARRKPREILGDTIYLYDYDLSVNPQTDLLSPSLHNSVARRVTAITFCDR